MGATVVVGHGDGLTSTYVDPAFVPMVAMGDAVGVGSMLDLMDGIAITKNVPASYLHSSMSLDGSIVDPLEYLSN